MHAPHSRCLTQMERMLKRGQPAECPLQLPELLLLRLPPLCLGNPGCPIERLKHPARCRALHPLTALSP